MRSLKSLWVLSLATSLTLVFSSCKKDNDVVNAVSKEEMAGKWKLVIQVGSTQTWNAVLKASGAMEVDIPPYDGVADYIFLWDINGYNFSAHVDANGIANYWEMHSPIDPKTLSMAGEIKVNDPNTPQTGVFTMEKQ